MITERESLPSASQSAPESRPDGLADSVLDLERLVWDPAYRRATRHLWQGED